MFRRKHMAVLIREERCSITASLIFFLANENGTGFIRDQCCHLQGDGASLPEWPKALLLKDKKTYG